MPRFPVVLTTHNYREVEMDPHDTEATVAINEIKDFYGSVDSIAKRKIFKKQKICKPGELKNEPEQDLVAAGCHETEFEI